MEETAWKLNFVVKFLGDNASEQFPYVLYPFSGISVKLKALKLLPTITTPANIDGETFLTLPRIWYKSTIFHLHLSDMA